MPLNSMTGFADCPGAVDTFGWIWEARSVNGRGLDLRLRLSEGFESLETPLRQQAQSRFTRGSVTIALKIVRPDGASLPQLREPALAGAIQAALAASEAAGRLGLDLAPMTAADLLAVRGVVEVASAGPADDPSVLAAVTAAIEPLLDGLVAARVAEGVALASTVEGQLDRVTALVVAARASAEARAGRSGALLRSRLEAVLATAGGTVDEARLAQELALLAVRADVTEELDRLDAHIAAARQLLADGGAVGRRLDFLMQEFNREANTLCAKSGASDLTAIGLELKVVIDQMREQVQNVE